MSDVSILNLPEERLESSLYKSLKARQNQPYTLSPITMALRRSTVSVAHSGASGCRISQPVSQRREATAEPGQPATMECGNGQRVVCGKSSHKEFSTGARKGDPMQRQASAQTNIACGARVFLQTWPFVYARDQVRGYMSCNLDRWSSCGIA